MNIKKHIEDYWKGMTDGICVSIVLQLLGLLFCGLILDGGFLLRVYSLSIPAWWVIFLVIIIRRAGKITNTDKLYIKYGILFNFVILTPIALLLMSFIRDR